MSNLKNRNARVLVLATALALAAVTLTPGTASAHHSGGFWHQNWKHFRHFVHKNVKPRNVLPIARKVLPYVL